MAAKKWYAWSNLYNGGETTEVRGRNITVTRNMVECGSPVTKAKLGVSDEEWEGLIAGGSIRDYPYPADLPEGESPHSFVLRQQAEKLEYDPDVLLKMTASLQPDTGTSQDEEPEESSNN